MSTINRPLVGQDATTEDPDTVESDAAEEVDQEFETLSVED